MIDVLMLPHLSQVQNGTSGIERVIEAYFKHLPNYGIRLVDLPDKEGWGAMGTLEIDVLAVHAGAAMAPANVAHVHGLYWTADYHGATWEWFANYRVITNCRGARQITVPSDWVAETFRRDMRLNPTVVPHGIDVDDWEPAKESQGYVLWNKNRKEDVCDPRPMYDLARLRPDVQFVTTFTPEPLTNVMRVGVQPHDKMRLMVQDAGVYLSTTKETFGIGVLEAMASAVPVLGFAHGGNLDLIQHGVNGYLAEPGNMEDLANGLDYCLRHRAVLGANGREIAKRFTWEAAAEKVAGVYRLAMFRPPATAAIIIPCWNYADKVGRAIESATKQEFKGLTEIVVVDDGSDDHEQLARVVEDWKSRDPRVRLLTKQNGGVATARNAGIASTDATYVCCLDADDAIEPEFLTACIRELEADETLGIAYTKIHWIKADGSEGVSDWPDEFDYDKQLQRRNQIPTCCVFRREMWIRLGGYRQRYAPAGAGSEDAEFWLRAGAYGWGAKLASREGLFVYSLGTGRVSGDPNYHETDWMYWHPWTRDGQHPFPSLATASKKAHPVRQYDEPVISVVIPVGPGHEDKLINALDSLEAQTFGRWEAIIVDDTNVSDASHEKWWALTQAYPYMRVVHMAGGEGAGAARNEGARHARAPFLVFLDADDWLYPEALEKMLSAWGSESAIIYTDYVGIADVKNVEDLSLEMQKRVYSWRDGRAVIGHQAHDFNCNRAVQEPLVDYGGSPPYLWCNVTCLIPKAWHDEIHGFDEQMESWEDIDYHWRMAKAGHCYARLPEELLVYEFRTGSRRSLGLQEYPALLSYLRTKHREIPVAGCGCRGNGRTKTAGPKTLEASMNDQDLVMIRYTHPNRGGHMVIGAATGTKYGYRGGGEKFLVHKEDIRLQPDFFKPEEEEAAPPPAPPAPPPQAPAPQPLPEVVEAASEAVPEGMSFEKASAELQQSIDEGTAIGNPEMGTVGIDAPDPFEELPEPEPIQLDPPINVLKLRANVEQALATAGFTSVGKIMSATLEELMAIKGVGPKTAVSVREKAEQWEPS